MESLPSSLTTIVPGPSILPVPRVIRHDGQIAAISNVRHETRSCIEIINSPALLFFGREEGGRERLTIGPIGRIVSSAVRVARPPNAPAFSIRIVNRACTNRIRTLPSKKQPVPRSKIQSEIQKPQASASAENSARTRISVKPGHQSQKLHPQRKTSGYHLQGCHCLRKSAPKGPESKSQCLRAMSQCHNIGSIIQPEWEDNPHQSPRVATPNESANHLPTLNIHHNYLSLLELYTT